MIKKSQGPSLVRLGTPEATDPYSDTHPSSYVNWRRKYHVSLESCIQLWDEQREEEDTGRRYRKASKALSQYLKVIGESKLRSAGALYPKKLVSAR